MTYPSEIKDKSLNVGIIGAGQLAMMLCDAAKTLGLRPFVFANSLLEPAAQMADVEVSVGKLQDHESFSSFASQVSCIAFESELLDLDALKAALKFMRERGLPLPHCYPALEAMKLCSNKLQQKKLLDAAKIPTAPWVLVDPITASFDALHHQLMTKFPAGYVLKWARGGYDGLGTFLAPAPKTWDSQAFGAFLTKGWRAGSEIFAEEWIPFAHEVAVISTRAQNAQVKQWPTVITKQESGVCAEVRGPANQLGISASLADEAQTNARKIGEQLGLVGTFAVEFFVDHGGRVLVNEIAPRVHNSGHFSLNASTTSQFTNHWLALLAKPLGETSTAPYFGMTNILGPEDFQGRITNPFILDARHGQTYWYNKEESRVRRKLGHVNHAAQTPEELVLMLETTEKMLRQWHPTANPLS